MVMAGLEAFIRSGGAPDLDTYTQVIRRVFGEGTAWQEALTRRKEAYNPEKRLKWREPVPGPWLHGAIIHLLETGVRDEDNTEMDPFLLALPHLLLKIRDEDVVEECIKVDKLNCKMTIYVVLLFLFQISSLITSKLDSVRTLATTVQQVILMQESDFSTHDPVTKYVTDALDRNDTVDDMTMMEKFGKNCHLPGSYQGALYTFLKHRHDDERYAETIRSIIRGGGCNCSRANFAGALLGAEAGVESVPVSWIDQVSDIDHILAKIIDAVTFH